MKIISANMAIILEPPRLDDISFWAANNSRKSLRMLRLDLIHPVVSGNKLFKLKYNIEAAKAAGKSTLLSFGGGHSNHLVALAAAAEMNGMKSIGLVRGHYAESEMTKTLQSCLSYGMQLQFLTKAEYAAEAYKPTDLLAQKFPEAYLIPEGGVNENGLRGAAEIASYIPHETTHVCVAVGTGTTLAGLQQALPKEVTLLGFCAAKQCDLAKSLTENISGKRSPEILPMLDPRFGKWQPELLEFMHDFKEKTSIETDVVYTGKMMQKMKAMLMAGYFPASANILCIHTGGLQGNPDGLL